MVARREKHATCVERRKMKKGGCVCEGGGRGRALLESFRFEDENEYRYET